MKSKFHLISIINQTLDRYKKKAEHCPVNDETSEQLKADIARMGHLRNVIRTGINYNRPVTFEVTERDGIQELSLIAGRTLITIPFAIDVSKYDISLVNMLKHAEDIEPWFLSGITADENGDLINVGSDGVLYHPNYEGHSHHLGDSTPYRSNGVYDLFAQFLIEVVDFLMMEYLCTQKQEVVEKNGKQTHVFVRSPYPGEHWPKKVKPKVKAQGEDEVQKALLLIRKEVRRKALRSDPDKKNVIVEGVLDVIEQFLAKE